MFKLCCGLQEIGIRFLPLNGYSPSQIIPHCFLYYLINVCRSYCVSGKNARLSDNLKSSE